MIDTALASRLRAMTGFHNIAVHEYQAIDSAILKSIVADRLVDLEEFANAMRAAAS